MEDAVDLGVLLLTCSLFGVLIGVMLDRAATAWKKHRKGRKHSMTYQPLKLTTDAPESPAEREPLFYVDGVEFTIPKEVPPVLAVQYLRNLRGGSAEVALSKVFDELIGKEGVNALARVRNLRKSELAQIMGVIQEKVMGVLEDAQGN